MLIKILSNVRDEIRYFDEKKLKELKSLVGVEKVLTSPLDLVSHSIDPDKIKGYAEVVVTAEGVNDVINVIKFCRKYKIPVVPQGALSSVTGAVVPFGGVALDLQKMSRILEINIEDGYVVTEPGVRIDELNHELKKHDHYFPVDPTSSAVSTVGGAIAAGAGGIRGAKYGTVRDWVLGLKVVIGTGDFISLGCKTVKCRQGYDLTRLFVGSEGTLGVIVESSLQIWPLPESIRRLVAIFSSYKDGIRVIREIKKHKIRPLSMEFVDRDTMELVSPLVDFKVPDRAEFALIVDVDSTKESLGRVSKEVEDIMKNCGAILTSQDISPEEAEKIYLIRKRAASVIINISKYASYSEDITVPPSKLPMLMEEIYRIKMKYNMPIYVYGHIGDGNIHPRIVINSEDEIEVVKKLYDEIGRKAIELGGTTSGEHGIGLLKKELLKYEFEKAKSEMALSLMREIKKIFDPDNILNPGKVF